MVMCTLRAEDTYKKKSIFLKPENQESYYWGAAILISAFLTNQTVRIWSLHLHEDRPIREQGGDLCLYKSALHSQCALSLFTKGCIWQLFCFVLFLFFFWTHQHRTELSGGRGVGLRAAWPQTCLTVLL